MINNRIKELEEQLIPYEPQPGFSGFDFSYQSKVAGGRTKHKGRVANTKLMIQDLEGKTVGMLNIKPSQPIIKLTFASLIATLTA